jgi:hypothetical protein
MPFNVANISKLSRAADPWTSWVGVFGKSVNDIEIWGMYDQTVHYNTALVRESEGGWDPPGSFQIAANGVADVAIYYESALIARLSRDHIVDRENDVFTRGPIYRALLPAIMHPKSAIISTLGKQAFEPAKMWETFLSDSFTGTLCRILISIQRYRHGGAVLITSKRTGLDIKYGIQYDRLPKFLDGLADASVKHWLIQEFQELKYDLQDAKDIPLKVSKEVWHQWFRIDDFTEGITGAVKFVSALANVDGLVLLRPDLKVVGFGVEIRTKKDPTQVYVSTAPEPTKSSLSRISPKHFGMRHRSMMRYCFANAGSLGFVISQDGDIRAMTRVGQRLVMWNDVKVQQRSEAEFPVAGKKTKHPNASKIQKLLPGV